MSWINHCSIFPIVLFDCYFIKKQSWLWIMLLRSPFWTLLRYSGVEYNTKPQTKLFPSVPWWSIINSSDYKSGIRKGAGDVWKMEQEKTRSWRDLQKFEDAWILALLCYVLGGRKDSRLVVGGGNKKKGQSDPPPPTPSPYYLQIHASIHAKFKAFTSISVVL